MNPSAEEKVFVERVRATLDAGIEGLDAETTVRLRRARSRAVAAAGARRRRLDGWVPAAVAAGVVVTALWIGWRGASEPAVPAGSAAARLEAVDVLAGNANLDLYENLDFYAWLAHGSGHG